jgi:transposase
MYHHNVIALDLAKRVIQINKVTPPGEILFNKAVSLNKAKEIIANTKPCIVAMEGCGSFHYWGDSGVGVEATLYLPSNKIDN